MRSNAEAPHGKSSSSSDVHFGVSKHSPLSTPPSITIQSPPGSTLAVQQEHPEPQPIRSSSNSPPRAPSPVDSNPNDNLCCSISMSTSTSSNNLNKNLSSQASRELALPPLELYGNGGLSYAEQPSSCTGKITFPDLIGVNSLRSAYNLQVMFVDAMKSIINDFYKMLLESAMLRPFHADIAAACDSASSCVESAHDFALILKGYIERKQFALVAFILADEKNYLQNLGSLMNCLYDGFYKIRVMRGNSPDFCAVLAKCVCSKNENLTLDDVMLICASYPQHLLRICKTELAYRPALERALSAMHTTCDFCEQLYPDVPVVPPLVDYEIPGNDPLKPLGDVVLKSTELASWIGGSTVVRQIRFPPNAVVPDVLKTCQQRKLVGIIPGVLRDAQSFGLTFNVPTSLIIFSDCAVLCKNIFKEKFEKYVFIEFYYKDSIWLETDSDLKKIVLCNRLICQDEKFLPPGWEDVSNVRRKEHSFVYKPCGIKQEQNPMSVGCLTNKHTFIVASSQLFVQASQKLVELANNADMVEIKQPPHLVVGVDLTYLTEFDRLWNPELTMPEIFKVLIPHIMSAGLSEKGIFRVAAEKRILDELCLKVHTEELSKLDLAGYNINTISGLMKMFLRDMPNPLLPLDMYQDFMAVSGMRVEDRTKRLIELVQRLPKYNKEALTALMTVLYQIHNNQHVNSMDDKNLGIVTAPNILRNNSHADMAAMTAANTVVAFMVEHYEEIFENSILGQEIREAALASNEWVLFKRKLIGNIGGVSVMIPDPDDHIVLSFDTHGDYVVFDSNKRKYIKSGSVTSNLPVRIPPDAGIYHDGKFWIIFKKTLLVLDSKSLEVVHSAPLPAESVIVADEKIWLGGEGVINIISPSDYSILDKIEVTGIQSVFSMFLVEGKVWVACKKSKPSRVEIHVYDASTHALDSTFRTDMKDIFGMVQYGKTVWIASDNPSLSVWDIETKEYLARITSCSAYSICVLPDQIWFGSQDVIVIVDPKTYKCVGEVRGYQCKAIISIIPVIEKDRVEVWSGSYDRSVCVWSIYPLPDL